LPGQFQKVFEFFGQTDEKRFFSFIILLFAYSGKYRTFASKFDVQMKKEIGKWLMDVAKYVATAVLIGSFFGGLEPKWVLYVCGFFVVGILLAVGLALIKKDNK